MKSNNEESSRIPLIVEAPIELLPLPQPKHPGFVSYLPLLAIN